MIIIDLILIAVLLWNILIKKDYYSPLIFWCVIWIISFTFAMLNPYDMMKVSDKAIFIMGLGTLTFLTGCIGKKQIHFVFKKKQKKVFNTGKNEFNKWVCYSLLWVTFVFNLFVLATAIVFLRMGISYSNFRDILLGYSTNSNLSFFSSSFVSTFFSWIIGPAMSILLIILMLNMVIKQIAGWFNFFTFIDIAIYVFATSGRMLLLHAVIFLFFIYKFHGIQISKKLKRKVYHIGIIAIILLLVLTFFRRKNVTSVPSLYSYFCIDVPLFSYWMKYIDDNHIMTYGNAFLRGFLEFINYVLGKVGMATPNFWSMQETFDLIQNRWIEVFPGNWYNAYVSSFLYFYMDFGIIGVALGSYIFGKICKWSYRKLLDKKEIFYEIFYMLIIQTIADSFIRWQIGNFAFLVTFFYAYICTKHKRKGVK